MKINANLTLRDTADRPILDETQAPIFVRDVARDLLLNSRPMQMTANQLDQQIALADKFTVTSGEIEISPEEAALVRQLALDNMKPIGAYALRQALNGEA